MSDDKDQAEANQSFLAFIELMRSEIRPPRRNVVLHPDQVITPDGKVIQLTDRPIYAQTSVAPQLNRLQKLV